MALSKRITTLSPSVRVTGGWAWQSSKAAKSKTVKNIAKIIPGLNSRRRLVSFRLLVAIPVSLVFCFSTPLARTRTSLFFFSQMNGSTNVNRKKGKGHGEEKNKAMMRARPLATRRKKKKQKKKRANGRKRRSEGRGDDSNLSAKAQGRTGPPEICSCTRTSCRYLHEAARHTDKDQQRYLYFAPAQLRCVVLQVVLQVLVRTRARPLGSPVQKPSCTT